MAKDDGGAAFPSDHEEEIPAVQRGTYTPKGATWRVTHRGMSLRDYFAGQALMGFMHVKANEPDSTMFWNQVAIHCYEAADAMLAERAK